MLKKATGSSQQKQTRELDPTVLDLPGRGGNQRRQQDGGGLDPGHGEAKVGPRGSWRDPKTTVRQMEQSVQFAGEGGRLGGAHLP